MLHLSTRLSENTTPFDTAQITNYNMTDNLLNVSHPNTTVRDLNTTLLNTTALPVNTAQYSTTKPMNATSFSTAESPWNTSQAETTTNAKVTENITNPNIASSSIYITDYKNATASGSTTYGQPYTTASFHTLTDSVTTQKTTDATASENTTSFHNITASTATADITDAAISINLTSPNTASLTTTHSNATTSPLYTTSFHNATVPHNTVNFTNSPNTAPPSTTRQNITTALLYTSSFNNLTVSNTTVNFTNAVTSMNATILNTSQLNTTTVPLYTMSNFNATVSNTTVNFTDSITAMNISPNTTQLSTTASPLYTTSHTTLNFTSAVTTMNPNTTSLLYTSFNNMTESNTTLNFTEASVNMTNMNTTSSQPYTSNTTSPPFNTTEQQNATELVNTTHLKTSTSPLYTTAPNTTLHITNETISVSIPPPNTTSTFTTRSPLYTTSLNNMTDTNIDVYDKNTTELVNVTQPNTESPPPYTTSLTWFNTSSLTPNVTTSNTTDLVSETVPQLNATEFNTTLIPLNSTMINTTEPHNTTQYNETVKDGTTEFNNTTPAPVTAWINTTLVNFTTKANLEQNVTTSDPNATETGTTSVIYNTTLETTFIYNSTADFQDTAYTTMEPEHENFPINNMTSTQSTTDTTSPTTLPATTYKVQANHNATETTAPTIPVTQTAATTTTTTTTAATPPPTAPPPTTTTPPPTTTTPTTTTPVTTTDAPDVVANELLNQSIATINSSEVQKMVEKLENIVSTPNISMDLGQKVLSVINHLLDTSTDAMAPSSSNRLIKAVDTLGLKLFIRDKTESIVMGSLALMVTKIDGNNFMGTSFSITDPMSLEVKGRRRRSVSSSQLGSITLPSSLTEGLSPEERLQASRIQFTFYNKSTLFQEKNNPLTLDSLILGTSVANLSIKGLRENVEFTMKNKQSEARNRTCVFWDFEKNEGAGGWSNVGCAVMNTSTENETVCSCNHLTSFAVLMDISRGGITDRLQATILTFISYIGCGISAMFLAITLLSYLAFEKIRRDIPSKILINLCFALLLLNMVFLLDSWLALYPDAVGLCTSTAFFLHYFLLASFTWMGLEALHLYLAIVKVFNSMSRYMLKFAMAGWGVPLVVVIIVIAVDKNNYGIVQYGKYTDGTTDDFCWLSNNIAFYVAVVAYFCVIFVFNLIMFVVVMVQLRRIKRQNPHNNQYRSGIQDLRSIAGLTILLGLTWGFAFFAWGPVNLAFMYLFTICNSLQGLFIFVFHCALKETVRRQWRTYLCCGKYRLAENSDWSRTATQNTKKTSLATVNMSRQSPLQSTSRSSSMSTNSFPHSNIINTSTEDSVSTSMEDSSGDVVLNEINSHHRLLHRTD